MCGNGCNLGQQNLETNANGFFVFSVNDIFNSEVGILSLIFLNDGELLKTSSLKTRVERDRNYHLRFVCFSETNLWL